MIKKVNRFFTGVGLFLSLGLLSTHALGSDAILYTSECINNTYCKKKINLPSQADAVIEIPPNGIRIATGRNGTKSPAAIALFSKDSRTPKTQAPELKQIPIRFTQRSGSDDLGEVYAGLTEIIPNSNIFVGALHAFKRDIHKETPTIETQKELENLKIVLFKNIRSSSFLDLILFIPHNLSEESLKNTLNSISPPEINDPWISLQLGVMDTDTSTNATTNQFSEGNIIMSRDEGLGAPYFNLSNNSGNFTSAASSGSLILNKDYEPLGVLQCLETISGEESSRPNSTKLFRAISLNLDFNIVTPVYPRSLTQLIMIMAQELRIEPNCKPVDKNGAGGL